MFYSAVQSMAQYAVTQPAMEYLATEYTPYCTLMPPRRYSQFSKNRVRLAQIYRASPVQPSLQRTNIMTEWWLDGWTGG